MKKKQTTPKKLKILHTVKIGEKEYVAVILDEKNYGFGILGKSDKGSDVLEGACYFGKMKGLVEHIAKVTADRECQNMWNWLQEYRNVLRQFADGFKE